MKKFMVYVTSELEGTVSVEANSKEQAIEIARSNGVKSNVIREDFDITGVDFWDAEEEK